VRARKIELHFSHGLVAQVGHETRDDSVANNEPNLAPLAHLIAGRRALRDNDVFGIAIARRVISALASASVCPTNEGTVTVADEGIKKS
jgi:hypothetical protein